MKQIRRLLQDRRRSQRGSVLSGVLIITAFVAIIAGALLTELSTNFLLSRALVHRVSNEATVNSEVELAINGMQGQSVYQGCPALPTATLNGTAASATYLTCGATLDAHTTPPYKSIAATAPVAVDGTYSTQFNEYLVGDSAGTFYRYSPGQQLWKVAMGGRVSGPPQAMPDHVTITVPVVNPTVPASPGCGSAGTCVAVLSTGETLPECYLPTTAEVNVRPAAGVNNSMFTFVGASDGSLYAYLTAGAQCIPAGRVQLPQTIVAVAVFAGPVTKKSVADEIFVGMSDGVSSQLQQYEYITGKNGGFNFIASWGLAPGRASGGTFDSSTLPARAAVTFTNGLVEVLQVQSGSVTLQGQYQLPTTIAGSPTWCCGAGPAKIGVGGGNGSLYVLDASPTLLASYQTGGAINGTPSVDGGGDWFVGVDDGNVYEVPAIQSSPTTWSFGQSAFGAIGSSVQVVRCGSSACAYLASAQGGIYMVQLDARQATLWACIGSAPSSCSGDNPRLWANLQVGSLSSTGTVHVSGWSYYSV